MAITFVGAIEAHTSVPGNGTATATTASFTPAVGELLVVKVGTGSSLVSFSAPSGGSLTYSLKASSGAVSGYGEGAIFVATVATSAAMTVSVTFNDTSVQASAGEVVVERYTGVATGGSPATNVVENTTAQSTLTTTASNSVLTYIDVDYNGTTGTPTYVNGGTQTALYQNSSVLSCYSARMTTTASGSYSYGLSAPASQKSTLVAIEILSAATDVSHQSSPGGAEQGNPHETLAVDYVHQSKPSGAEQGSPADTHSIGSVQHDTSAQGAEQSGTAGESPTTATTFAYDPSPEGAEQADFQQTDALDLVVREAPGTSGEITIDPDAVEEPLPPELPDAPTEAAQGLVGAPQVSEAALRFYASLGQAFIEGDGDRGWPLLRFCESGGRLLQNIEDVTKGSAGAPGWSALFDLSRCPTYGLPWLGQMVGVVVDPTLTDTEQRQQIYDEAATGRGTPARLRQVALSFLRGPAPEVEVIERDGNAWTVTVTVYAAQLVGKSYAELAAEFPTYPQLNAAYATYEDYAVGYNELNAALQAAKPAGLILNLVVRTGASYAVLSRELPAYPQLDSAFTDYAHMIGAVPVS
ncbi:phage tail protein [Actinomycetospora endophytica]|uniref:Phage tail protein n=1 Tax=Actinomycetospora endophytica TaxID=2291215 RepID=A0ABS8P5K2_9PSEU|nr:phage tail protein [Actinomycetospora endophytica]MCD2193531.1 phage tail protein [Actinomycetospora endophytica]